MFIDILKDFFNPAQERSFKARKSIIISFIAKGISFVASLAVVPLTISYVSPSQYGVWLTLSSIIGWVAIMDLGLGNGFRNKFAEAKAIGNIELANHYVSTAYFSISCVSLLLFPLLLLLNHFVDWSIFLNVDRSLSEELHKVFIVLALFFCLNMIVNLLTILLTADQRQGIASVIVTGGQVASLAVIWILVKVSDGSLLRLAVYFSGVPCLFLLLMSILLYNVGEYKFFKPKVSKIRIPLIRNILDMGIVFFLTNICVILVFQLTNIVLSREIGPEIVAQYNVAFKYYNIIYVIALIIITPYWSAFTDAFTKNDIEWMQGALHRLEMIAGIILFGGLLLFVVSPLFFRIWLGDKIIISRSLSLAVLIYFSALVLSSLYTYLVAGTGKMRIQFFVYLVTAVFSYPLLVFCARKFGVVGIVIPPVLVSILEIVFCRIQLGKLMHNKANGWWGK